MLDAKDWLELANKCKTIITAAEKEDDLETRTCFKLGYAIGFVDGLIEYLEAAERND